MESIWEGFPQSCWGRGRLVEVGKGWEGEAYAVDEDAEVRGGLGADVEVFHFDLGSGVFLGRYGLLVLRD